VGGGQLPAIFLTIKKFFLTIKRRFLDRQESYQSMDEDTPLLMRSNVCLEELCTRQREHHA
jgi:hypothetical protein